MDFTVNANGTLNLLEAARNFCPETPFVFTSTNKVYGDTPNRLPLRELPLRWEIEPGHEYEPGISENMSIDQTKHSLFGASKVAADVLVQEYGRYFGMPTVCFRGGCLTGPAHAGTELHGFLSYLMKCAVSGRPYRVFGYKGKQVRDNIHSFDLVEAFAAFIRAPRVGGGLQHRRQPPLQLLDARGDRAVRGNQRTQTYRGNTSRTTASATTSGGSATCANSSEHYPEWKFRYGLREILEEIHAALVIADVLHALGCGERGRSGNHRTARTGRRLVQRAHASATATTSDDRYCSPSSSGAVTTRSGIAQTFIMTAIQ